MVKLLLLWDIDGTLIDSGNAGERALRRSIQGMLGLADDLSWLEWAGRTDLWIARQILEHHRQLASPENIQRLINGYLECVAIEMSNPRARVLPGVSELLATLEKHPGVAQGLLTGNVERGAKIKLSHFDLWRYFSFGAFADDSEHRNELGPHALRRASDHHQVRFTADQLWVIGDTPHDIACGRAVGARTVAVATGKFSQEALQSCGPDLLFADLSNHDAFLEQTGIAHLV